MQIANSQQPTAKILLAAPISQYKDYVIKDWLNHLTTIQGSFDILLVDNSKDPEYYKTLQPATSNQQQATILHIDPTGKTAQQFILESRQLIRAEFLKGDYTHLFSLECDVFCPKDTIPRLLAHNLPIVSGWYFVGTKKGSYPLFVQANILPKSKVFNVYMASFLQSFLLINGRLVNTIGNGIGATLITREIVEKIPFRIDPNDIGFDDSFFNQDVWRNGYDHFCDTSLHCEHRNFNWEAVKEYQEIDKTTGKNKILNFSEPDKMEIQQIQAAITDCKEIIGQLYNHQTILNNLMVALQQQKKPGNTFADNAIIDKKIMDTTRDLWNLKVEILAKENCLKYYSARAGARQPILKKV